MTLLHFSISLPRDAVCPICVQSLVARAMVFIEGHAFCVSCTGLRDSEDRLYADLCVAKHRHHQDGRNWSTAFGLAFYTPSLITRIEPYILHSPIVNPPLNCD